MTAPNLRDAARAIIDEHDAVDGFVESSPRFIDAMHALRLALDEPDPMPDLNVCVGCCTESRQAEVATVRARTRVPDGTPHVRDVVCPCDAFVPGTPNGDCYGDGHYLCHECEEYKPESERDDT